MVLTCTHMIVGTWWLTLITIHMAGKQLSLVKNGQNISKFCVFVEFCLNFVVEIILMSFAASVPCKTFQNIFHNIQIHS